MTTQIKNALDLANTLVLAINGRLMAHEHGAKIWKNFLKDSKLDVAKSEVKKETKKAKKGE